MKRQAVMTVVALAAGVLLAGGTARAFAQPGVHVDVSFRADFSDLDDYGEWYKLPKVGWVWVPDADRDWRPFTYGHWAWTRHGWTWISYEPFGWAVCHYGNWYYDDEMGWARVPGYDWSPARVNGIVTDFEISWAPLTPPWVVLPPLFGPFGPRFWCTVPARHFTSENVYEYRIVGYAPGPFAHRVLRKEAPDVAFIRKKIGRPVVTVTVEKRPHGYGQGRVVELRVPGMARQRAVPPIGPSYRRKPMLRGEGQGPGHDRGPGPADRPERGPREDQGPRGHGPGPHKEIKAQDHSAASQHPPASSPPPGQGKDDDQGGSGRPKQKH